MSKILLTVQARSKSTRLPGKIFETIGEKPLLDWVHEAAKDAQKILNGKNLSNEVIILGPEGDTDLAQYCSRQGFKFFLPSCPEDDVLTRYLKAAEQYDASIIVRITADCWMANPEIIAEIAALCKQFDYVSNTVARSFMEGLDVQACTKKALRWFDKVQKEKREHPFYFFDRNEVMRELFEAEEMTYTLYMNPRCEWTIHTSIDTKEDLERARHFVARRPSMDDLILKENRGQ